MKFTPPTLRQVVDGFDSLIRSAQMNVSMLHAGDTYVENCDRAPTRIIAPHGSKDPICWIREERKRLASRFGCEALHWRKEKNHWRRMLDEHPEAADQPLLGAPAPNEWLPKQQEYPEPGSAG